MEIIHQLTFKSKNEPKLLKLIESSGIKINAINLPNQDGQSISFQISESNKIWPYMSPFLVKSTILHSFETIFSEVEILEAKWLRIVNVVEKGHPQPEKTWATNPNNYNELCKSCGIFQQTSAFHIAKEPKLGKTSFMSLIWASDSLFAVPEVIDLWKGNEISGYESWEAIIHKDNIPAKSISQIFIPTITSPGLLGGENLTKTICPDCGTVKYAYHRNGMMLYRQVSIPTGVDIVKTYEWFGSGRFAFREILISNKLARKIIEKKWLGLILKDVQVI